MPGSPTPAQLGNNAPILGEFLSTCGKKMAASPRVEDTLGASLSLLNRVAKSPILQLEAALKTPARSIDNTWPKILDLKPFRAF